MPLSIASICIAVFSLGFVFVFLCIYTPVYFWLSAKLDLFLLMSGSYAIGKNNNTEP